MIKALKSSTNMENIVHRGEWIYARFKDIRANQK